MQFKTTLFKGQLVVVRPHILRAESHYIWIFESRIVGTPNPSAVQGSTVNVSEDDLEGIRHDDKILCTDTCPIQVFKTLPIWKSKIDFCHCLDKKYEMIPPHTHYFRSQNQA